MSLFMSMPADPTLSVLAYMACSSLALVSNKVTLHYLPAPASIFVVQISASILAIQVLASSRLIVVDRLSWANIQVFIPYICSFVVSLYSNGRALANANVETIIVFRSCSPLCVSVLDWLFLGRELPSLRSLLALLGVLGGAIGYVLCDSEFALNGVAAYFWVSLNLTGIVFEMTYGKRLISNVRFDSPVWGAVLYTNVLSVAPMMFLAASTSELQKVGISEAPSSGFAWLAVSCVIGLGISWSGWNCRSKISATYYTLVGVICKFVSVVLNLLLWDKHATPLGLAMLSICLVSSSMYQQAPLRGHSEASPTSKATNVQMRVGSAFHLAERDDRGDVERTAHRRAGSRSPPRACATP